ncbi:hypothetical protein DCO58_11145 [Helicobacter saguini]|uniref:Prepilin peptidase n=1 Tax=Helicobacter saguini TaxID=1548018 RepID=A0A347VPZ1_9HELI|nr:A24 family peptidase [Helicobacter saguini]MWV61149.1 hypothetical protein [Helicobacter saguini]MWV68182.1 hypothetical protein [Helicobacter saguini]MWV70354.1 hypothetical protein [Helicobacter saguini]MWV72256.1 hypothetical protein [Helicobacter saguini]TLD95301.1 prepilin peptidase [Helicobacter saguini]
MLVNFIICVCVASSVYSVLFFLFLRSEFSENIESNNEDSIKSIESKSTLDSMENKQDSKKHHIIASEQSNLGSNKNTESKTKKDSIKTLNLDSKDFIESKITQDSIKDSIKFFSFKNLAIFCVIFALCFFALKLESSLNFNDFYFLFSIVKSNLFDMILSACLSVFFTLLLVLSLLDFKNLYVPNVLIFALFALNLAMFALISVALIFIPFAILGVFYFFYFTIHIFSRRELMGSGDIWALSSSSSVLLLCYPLHFELIFHLLIISSILGITFALFTKFYSKIDSIKIPFIPFITLALFIICAVN